MMRGKRHYIVQFCCLMGVFVATMLQGFTHAIPLKPLSQYAGNIQVQHCDLNFQNYLDGTYQDCLAQQARKHTGFREFYSRCYNQMAYDCFGICANKHIVEGKDHEFFLTGHIDDVTGKLLRSKYGTVEAAKTIAQQNVRETKTLMDTLRKHGTRFLFVVCPTKPAVYPECLPESYQDSLSVFCLADYYVQLFKENGIPHIDFYQYFKKQKETFPYPLYTRTGTHWAASTMPFVCDSLFRKMEEILGCQLPKIHYIDPNPGSKYTEQDGELEHSLNLLFPLAKPKVPRPIFTLQDTVGKSRPNLVVVGDGYFVSLEKTCFLDAFDSWNYLKYNDYVISSNPDYSWKHFKYLPEARQVLENADIVMAVYTSNYLFDYMNGFTQSAIALYQKDSSDEDELRSVMESIKDNPEWLRLIEQQAKERGITMEENLRINAEYILEQKEQKQP